MHRGPKADFGKQRRFDKGGQRFYGPEFNTHFKPLFGPGPNTYSHKTSWDLMPLPIPSKIYRDPVVVNTTSHYIRCEDGSIRQRPGTAVPISISSKYTYRNVSDGSPKSKHYAERKPRPQTAPAIGKTKAFPYGNGNRDSRNDTRYDSRQGSSRAGAMTPSF